MRLRLFQDEPDAADRVGAATTGEPEMPCIRCGACANVCPSALRPQQLLWQLRAENLERAHADGLFNCIDCGRCDGVCPSHIPLARTFLDAKMMLRQRAQRLANAVAARERFESRQRRLQREAIAQAERSNERKSQVANPDAVAAALQRAKAKKLAQDKDAGS
jgi:electron transport complex protein RnfC